MSRKPPVPFQIRPADMIFVRGRGWIVQPIKAITQSPYSHVVGYVKNDLFIGVQDFKRTRYEHLDHYKGLCDVYTCESITPMQRLWIVSYAVNQLGSRYDHLLLLWQAARHLFGVALPYRKNSRRICSTLWADAYRSIGVDLCPGIKYPTPGDMAQSTLLKQIGSF